jgi:hypothetical protein
MAALAGKFSAVSGVFAGVAAEIFSVWNNTGTRRMLTFLAAHEIDPPFRV